MTWLRLEGTYWLDPKVAAVSAEAELLYVRALGYAVTTRSDGRVIDDALMTIARQLHDPEALAAELVRAGLWQRVRTRRGKAWTVPPATWAKYQRTAAEIEQQRKRWRTNTSTYRKRQRHRRVIDDADTEDARVSSGVIDLHNMRENNPSGIVQQGVISGRGRAIDFVVSDLAGKLSADRWRPSL